MLHKLSRPLLYAFVALTASCATCDEETSPRPQTQPPPVEQDMADMSEDMPVADMGPEPCEGPECDAFESFDDCPRVKDLGVLKVSDGDLALRGSTSGLDSSIEATCTRDGGLSPDFVYALEVDEPVFIQTSLGLVSDVDWVVEARVGKCEAQAAVQCLDSGETLFYAEPGKKYFVVLEPVSGTLTGEFSATLSFTQLVCAPPSSTTCDMGTLQLCEGGTNERALACGVACQMDICSGDTCQDAVPISAAAGTQTFEGTLEAFSNVADTARMDLETCALGTFMGQPQLATPGPEIFYALQGLRAGQRVVVDAKEDLNDNALYIFRGCDLSAVRCLAAEDLSDALDFVVPEDGDYTLVIDTTVEQGQAYKHTITILD